MLGVMGWENRTINGYFPINIKPHVFPKLRITNDVYAPVPDKEDLVERMPDWFYDNVRAPFVWYELDGVMKPHRLDHQITPKPEMTKEEHIDVLCSLLHLSGLKELQDRILVPCGLPPTDPDGSAPTIRNTSRETKCPYQSCRDANGVNVLLAKGLGVIKALKSPYVYLLYSIRTLTVAIPILRGDGSRALEIISILIDADNEERAIDEHHT